LILRKQGFLLKRRMRDITQLYDLPPARFRLYWMTFDPLQGFVRVCEDDDCVTHQYFVHPNTTNEDRRESIRTVLCKAIENFQLVRTQKIVGQRMQPRIPEGLSELMPDPGVKYDA
jgi:hypothetical protein